MNNSEQVLGQVRFQDRNCDVILRHYPADGYAIQLDSNDFEDGNCIGETILTATCKVREHSMQEDSVVIKNYSQNEGIMPILIDAGIISPPYAFVRRDDELCPVCHVTYLTLDEVE